MKKYLLISFMIPLIAFISCNKDSSSDIELEETTTIIADDLALPTGTIYWVDASMDDDSGDGLSESTAKKNIQAALDLALQPGDGVYIKSGIYKETHPNFTHMEDGQGSIYASWLIMADGSKEKPIYVMAAPGHEGKVICDGQNANVGFHLNFRDYIVFRGLKVQNTRVSSIVNWGSIESHVYNEEKLSIGVVVENCVFDHVRGRFGKNISHVSPWASKDWIIRNNVINDSYDDTGDRGSGIQAFGVINALVQNNTISNTTMGVFWKDHYVMNEERDPVFESEVSYNIIKNVTIGIHTNARAGEQGYKSCEAGTNYFHHNIITDFTQAGIDCSMSSALGQSAGCTIENNIIDAKENNGTAAISVDGVTPVTIRGNIFQNADIGLELVLYDSENTLQLTEADYNIYSNSFQNIVDRYGDRSDDTYYRNLSDWQAITENMHQTIDMNNPDVNSILSSDEELFVNTSQNDYNLTVNSSASGFMPDGSNAGAYQNGNETIGAN